MGVIGIMYVVGGILYTIACCMDGPDLKPLWKKAVGKRLEKVSNYFYPIEYVTKTEYLPSEPIYIEKNTFDAVPVESCMELSEGDICEARMYQDMMCQHGIPEWQIPRHKNVSFMVEEAKEKCVRNLLNEARRFAMVEVDEESRWPGIIIRAKILVGRNKNIF